ncbi:unnamed protein product [Parascedosporium putredinis]|uniref:Uncharacterized protein n=1 Tax=Parascedosporium putredinis TaxID=1442378 RepID=A0A9P1H3N2_9PEZI|nr:unnamed protein product [Parascedosporium putredinis]CAI7994875.1 unnamed protein product [Parascedosporium putredinis]
MTIANIRMVQTIGKRNYDRNVAYMPDVISQRIFEAAEEWKIGCPGARAGSGDFQTVARRVVTPLPFFGASRVRQDAIKACPSKIKVAVGSKGLFPSPVPLTASFSKATLH